MAMTQLPVCQIVPTPVGVNRVPGGQSTLGDDCPHARGGEPSTSGATVGSQRLSPRPWG